MAPCQQSADHRCGATSGLSSILLIEVYACQGYSAASWSVCRARGGFPRMPGALVGEAGRRWLSRAPFPLPLPYFLQQGRGLLAEWVRTLRGREKGGLETDILPLPRYSTGPSSHRAASNQEEGNRAYLSLRVMSNNLHAPLTRHAYLVPNMVLGFAKTDEDTASLTQRPKRSMLG